MRFLISLAAAGLLLSGSTPAGAFNIVFGSATNLSSCSQAGNSADRSCTNSISVNNGALDNTASFLITGQSSADHGLTTNPTAIADMTVTYDIPYTVTRTVTVSSFTMSIPVLSLTFNANYSGTTGHDNSQVGGGLANAVAYTASLSDPGTNNVVFGGANYAGSSNGGGGGPSFSPFNTTGPDPSATLTAAYQGSVGEISAAIQLPTNFRTWTDSVAPYANGGSFPNGNYITQSYSDVLRVSFRLRAESRPSGSVSTTGGEAIACAGQNSPLGGFDLDNGNPCGGGGFSLVASLSQVGSFDFLVPEPSSVALLGAGVLGLLWTARRSRRG